MAFARQHRARKISMFGSLLHGELRADSDIDFLVELAGFRDVLIYRYHNVRLGLGGA